MTKWAHVEREHAIGMLKANVTPSVVAKRFRDGGGGGAMLGRLDVLRIVSTPSASRASTCVDATSRSKHPDVSFVQSISSGVSHS